MAPPANASMNMTSEPLTSVASREEVRQDYRSLSAGCRSRGSRSAGEPRRGRHAWEAGEKTGMAQTCDGCGEKVTRWSYAADGRWAGKLVCRECGRRGMGLKRLSWAATFKVKLAQVLPPDDPKAVPVLRLL